MNEAVANLQDRIAAKHVAELPHTDLGNAERLVELHGADLRFVPAVGWHVWDGCRWRRDEDGAVMRRMKETARAMREQAGKLEGEKAKALFAWGARSESRPRLEAGVKLAESEQAVIASAGELNADPFLLCVANGTVDLRSGELHDHDREHLITKLAPVEYEPDARDERWEQFLAETTGGDAELLGFLPRFAGYMLTGSTEEEKLLFAFGATATGKSTFLEALKGTLGDYAVTADFETFLRRRDSGGPRSGLAQLAGARMVVSIEVDEGRRLAEGLVKTLTSGEMISASFLYSNPFVYRPQFKLCLAANHAPKVSDDDDAIWRRILRVPFERQVPAERRDASLKAHLREPNAAILAWALKGCLAWQQHGLGVPPAVERSTADYRGDMDPLQDFIDERCVEGPDQVVTSSALWMAYSQFAKDIGERQPLSQQGLAERLRARGCDDTRRRVAGKRQRSWLGIGLRESQGQL